MRTLASWYPDCASTPARLPCFNVSLPRGSASELEKMAWDGLRKGGTQYLLPQLETSPEPPMDWNAVTMTELRTGAVSLRARRMHEHAENNILLTEALPSPSQHSLFRGLHKQKVI